MDAARYMVGGDPEETGFEIDEGILEDLKVLGATPEMLEAARRSMATQHDFELFEDNVDAARVFGAMGTQWRYRGMDGQPVGLDYAPLPCVMRFCSVRSAARGQVFEDVRLMEAAALQFFAERAR